MEQDRNTQCFGRSQDRRQGRVVEIMCSNATAQRRALEAERFDTAFEFQRGLVGSCEGEGGKRLKTLRVACDCGGHCPRVKSRLC
jgi:hypothetical protein